MKSKWLIKAETATVRPRDGTGIVGPQMLILHALKGLHYKCYVCELTFAMKDCIYKFRKSMDQTSGFFFFLILTVIGSLNICRASLMA